ncbi:phosphate ABC transporter membrane protein 1, PhoT family [Nitrosomonas aestuarii]|uniref:Phosphate transport system permease protein n=1 Tax=Nitrosomonas aestuarii TaxID=52441 RepID=A0A1I4AXS1_9PROT|nr:phosphate ABC transporter permease subunit PstC [Nitrosomonas aestuarii]SFK61402.1 phosphate ABC transporter membrane protein 1, PhoT family [Nitrosomonas aestuarii]
MEILTLVLMLAILTATGFYLGRRRALAVSAGDIRTLNSLPGYYGYYVALCCGIPAIFVFVFWQFFESTLITYIVVSSLPEPLASLPEQQLNLVLNEIRNLVNENITGGQSSPEMLAAADRYREVQKINNLAIFVMVMTLGIGGATYAWSTINAQQRARNKVELIILSFLFVCSTIAIFTTLGIVLSVVFEAMRFFQSVPITDFLFGLEWSPQTAIRSDQVGSSGAFGAVPLFAGTMLVSAIAMFVAVPVGLMTAIYLSEYASPRVRSLSKPMLEILAGVPTVVYGFFAALTIAPLIRGWGETLGLSVSSESALAAGVVMGIMIIPFVSSLSDDAINAVPQSLRDGAHALGAMQSETIKKVIIPAALPGIVGGVLLAASRAIGETMIVVMAAGLAANLTANPLESVTTVTAQIVTLLVGDQEFDSPKTLAAFALGLVLFTVTLTLNVIALYVVRKYREQYE